ncbi:hypothetical protein [Azospirillum halopraeferens]|uniref:hypothetical protein n=1 Tax=Azospirillum halopraeferens TaxID=34010 RepID=UPI0003F91C57|nr:hypothetical protein [Azospirillum halopraeferens]
MPAPTPHPTRYAIQKARGKGWTTLEVGEELAPAEARFALMVKLNPRAYFRLIELELNPDSAYEGMEFNWKLLKLHDPTGRPAAPRPRRRDRHRGRERVPLPVRFYVGVVVAGALIGLALYLAMGRAPL